jgi:hypothetical protein
MRFTALRFDKDAAETVEIPPARRLVRLLYPNGDFLLFTAFIQTSATGDVAFESIDIVERGNLGRSTEGAD